MLKRIERGFCDENCFSGCIATEKEVLHDIKNILTESGCDFYCMSDEEGISIQLFSTLFDDTLDILFVRNHFRVEHKRKDITLGTVHQSVHTFRGSPELIVFLVRTLPMDC